MASTQASRSDFVKSLPIEVIRSQFTDSTASGYKGQRSTCKFCHHTSSSNITRQKNHLVGCHAFHRSKILPQQRTLSSTLEIRTMPLSKQEKAAKMAATAIFTTGLSFSLLENDKMKAFLHFLEPSFRPPTGDTIEGWLNTVWAEYREKVLEHVAKAKFINIIIDGSDDTAGNRLINVSFQIPNATAFYWETIDTGTARHSAEGYLSLIEPIILDLVGGDTSKINSVVTDTNSTMRLFHQKMAERPAFSHILYTLCDSHGFQLLIKDILQTEPWNKTFIETSKIITTFKKSKIQLAVLRKFQVQKYGQRRSLITSVITRWGSQMAALRSVSGSKEALQEWARHVSSTDNSSLNGQDRSNLNEVITTIKNPNFWRLLEVLTAILHPVGAVQHRSETDRLHVGHTINNWNTVSYTWQQLQRSQEWLEVDWPVLFSLLEARKVRQTLDIHHAAWALDPATRTTNLTVAQLTSVESFLQRFCTVNDWPEVQIQFNQFRAQAGTIFDTGEGMKAFDFWLRLSNTDLALAKLAIRVFSTLANSVPSERSFSATNFLHNKVRNRLSAERANRCAFIYINDRVLERLKPSEGSKRVIQSRWEEVEAPVLIEMEDEWMELFGAAIDAAALSRIVAEEDGEDEIMGLLSGIPSFSS
jgi:hypothetical protein